ncbi:hypothetical protein DKP78_21395, partial [Enterococcus faecium]
NVGLDVATRAARQVNVMAVNPCPPDGATFSTRHHTHQEPRHRGVAIVRGALVGHGEGERLALAAEGWSVAGGFRHVRSYRHRAAES